MSRSAHNTTKLPKQLLAQLGISDGSVSRKYGARTGPRARKEQRKAVRIGKKARKPAPYGAHGHRRQTSNLNGNGIESSSEEEEEESLPAKPDQRITQPPKPALKQSAKSSRHGFKDSEPASRPQISRGVKDRLAADDAEIQALERALGVKSKSKLPKAFEDEGLGDLLEGIDESSDDSKSKKRRRGGNDDDWLEAKRRKARGPEPTGNAGSTLTDEGDDDRSSDSVSDEASYDVAPSEDEGSEESFLGFDDQEAIVETRTPKKRENPYVAPDVPSTRTDGGKYIPPSKRASNGSNGEDLSQLRRQVQGLLNKLSDANLLTILGDVEKLYRTHPRQHVTTTLVELLLGLVFDPSALQDTFLILHAGFVSAIFKAIGMDFGAQLVQQSVAQFDILYGAGQDEGIAEKRLRNMTAFLAYLYSFQTVGSNLMYDFIRLFLDDISERNTELLLKILQSAGPQLRQDDPSSLKDIVCLLQSSLARVPPEDVSVRTKFMVETVNNLKNNRMKTGLTASSIASEHVIRMKKILGSLHSRGTKASEPLRIGLKDIRETDKRGKWWLVGASFRGDEQDWETALPALESQKQSSAVRNKDASFSSDLLDLARAHRMNTDIRRSIFVTIMSATDYRDAHVRLLKLRLKKAQELEIPKVLLHCATVEETYNPYYTLIARKLCADKKLKISFQFALWDAFKRMSGDEDDDDDNANGRGTMDTKEIVHLAKMYGSLVADGGLTLSVLKPLNLSYLSPKAHTWLELFLITVVVQSQKDRSKGQRNELALKRIFAESIDKEQPEKAVGLKRFLLKYVRKTDVAGGKEERRVVRWGVDVMMRDANASST